MFIKVRTSTGNMLINVEHITHVAEDINPKNVDEQVGSWIHIITKDAAVWTSMAAADVMAAIDQAYAAEQAAYTMLVDSNEGWPVYNGLTVVPPKDRN